MVIDWEKQIGRGVRFLMIEGPLLNVGHDHQGQYWDIQIEKGYAHTHGEPTLVDKGMSKGDWVVKHGAGFQGRDIITKFNAVVDDASSQRIGHLTDDEVISIGGGKGNLRRIVKYDRPVKTLCPSSICASVKCNILACPLYDERKRAEEEKDDESDP